MLRFHKNPSLETITKNRCSGAWINGFSSIGAWNFTGCLEKRYIKKCWNQITCFTNLQKFKFCSKKLKHKKLYIYYNQKNLYIYLANTFCHYFPHTSGTSWCVENSEIKFLKRRYVSSLGRNIFFHFSISLFLTEKTHSFDHMGSNLASK